MKSIEIRANRDAYMRELRAWLSSTADMPLEEMSAFFAKRLDSYEAHMSAWGEAYQKFASFLPTDCTEILDLGCGTGLEAKRLCPLPERTGHGDRHVRRHACRAFRKIRR